MMARPFAIVLLFAAFPLAARDFTDCHVSFDAPRRWIVEVSRDVPEKVCEIAMEPRNREELVEKDGGVWRHGVSVEVLALDFEKAVEEAGGFGKDADGSWVVFGRQGMTSPATEISANGWKGLTAVSESGCHFEDGGYAGLCEVFIALVSNGKWTAEVVANSESKNEFDRLMKSLKFLE